MILKIFKPESFENAIENRYYARLKDFHFAKKNPKYKEIQQYFLILKPF